MIGESQLELDFARVNLNPACFRFGSDLLGEVERYLFTWFEGGEALVRAACTPESVAEVAVPAARLHNSLIDFFDELLLYFFP